MPDETMLNPAVKAYRDKFRKCPNRGLRKDIIVTVQDLALWLKILNSWRYRVNDRWKAKNPMAVKEMLTEYERLEADKRDNQASLVSARSRERLSERSHRDVSSMSSEPPSIYFRTR